MLVGKIYENRRITMDEKYLAPFASIVEKAKTIEKPMRVVIAGADAEKRILRR